MVDILGAMVFKAVHTAIKLGIFEELALTPSSLTQLANKLQADEKGLQLLTSVLCKAGYISENKGKYKNTAMTSSWILKNAENSLSGLIEYFDDSFKRWDYLDNTIKKGGPDIIAKEWLDKEAGRWQRYHAGMKSIATLTIPHVLKYAKIPAGAKTLLDIGGSHGLYSCALVQKHPSLKAVVLDAEEAKKTAVSTIEEKGLTAAINYHAGDIFTYTGTQSYDVILIFNFIRIFAEEKIISLFKKAAALLNPGGSIFVLDQFGNRHASDLMTLNENMVLLELYNSTRGNIYTPGQVNTFIKKADLKPTSFSSFSRSPGIGLITAKKISS
jgi:cyclopropane fatty-acyl-phospholipid synthase-like methyltransferase